jgi:hypothetical protein
MEIGGNTGSTSDAPRASEREKSPDWLVGGAATAAEGSANQRQVKIAQF